jgi:hypothetical protein
MDGQHGGPGKGATVGSLAEVETWSFSEWVRLVCWGVGWGLFPVLLRRHAARY